MWAIMASPLLISGNVRNMSDYVLSTYKNKGAIAINQDTLGKQGIRVMGSNLTINGANATNVWMKPLAGDEHAIAFLNVGSSAADIHCDAYCFAMGGLVSTEQKWCAVEVYSGKQAQIESPYELTATGVAAEGGSALFRIKRC